MRLAAARGLCFLSIALAAGCGGEDRAASRAAAPASTPSTPATTTAAAATGPTSEEAAWLGKASVSALMVKVDKDAAAFARTGTITLDISSIGGGEGECRQTLGSAGTPPTARLERVRKLARGACVQAERAADQMTPYTLTKKSGEVIEHPADPAAAAASMKRARKLAAQAQAALAAVEEG